MTTTAFLLILILHMCAGLKSKQGSAEYWQRVAAEQLKASRDSTRMDRRAKNIILFIGDGMSVATVTAARVWKAQRRNDSEVGRTLLAFEETPFVGMSKTYSDDCMVGDSGATACAMLSGVKINSLTIGVDSRVQFKNCSSYTPEADIKNIYTYAKEAGMSTGLVTNTQLTHATPAATYGHTANRFWMSDADVAKEVKDPELRKNCRDLASQFLTNAIDFNVVLAGGKSKFTPENEGGDRKDGRNILLEWQKEQTKRGKNARLVETKIALKAATKVKDLDRLLGIFTPGNFPYSDERSPLNFTTVPTLSQMATSAIQILSRNPNGFFLLVEGGRIDHAHHYGYARRALQETLDFEAAYEVVRRLTNPEETLTITTADHAHVFTIGGYPSRWADILGIPNHGTEGKGPGIAADDMAHTILLYANGPGAEIRKPRSDPSKDNTRLPTYQQQAVVPLRKETHGGDDVTIYARGPMAHLVNGVREQNYIAHVFMHAACLGPYRDQNDCPKSSAVSNLIRMWSVSIVALLCVFLIRGF